MTTEPIIRFPVIVPYASMSRWPSPVGLLAEALMRDGTLQLTGSCYEFMWNAGDSEREQIREYLAARVFGPASATMGL